MKSVVTTFVMVLSLLGDADAAESQPVPPVIHLFGHEFLIGPQPQPIPPIFPLFLEDFLLAPFVFSLGGDGHGYIGFNDKYNLDYETSVALKLPNGVQQKLVVTSGVKHFEYRTNGNQHWGFLQSPRDYTICKSALDGVPWAGQPTECYPTLTGWNTTTKSPDGIDGVHYYWVVPNNGGNGLFDHPNTCKLIDGVVVLFVRASMDRPSFCQATDIPTPTFHWDK